MAAENIGILFDTKIPGLGDPADIQQALLLYHYGSLDYNRSNADPSQLPSPSIARHIAEGAAAIAELQQKRTGGDVLPVEPTGVPIPDGYIWVDSSSSGTADTVYATAFYSATPPTQNLSNGIIWIDSSDINKKSYVWDGGINDWVEFNSFDAVVTTKGDILTVDNSGLQRFPVGQDGNILVADSSSATGLSWTTQLSNEEFEINTIMGVY